ncbi:MAG: hypothetical protein IJ841_02675 [Prevotella sp.]|nr:hypothetical protein [Prevotella sp.]
MKTKKNIWRFMTMMAIALTTVFTFSACGDDDDDNDNPLVGTWQILGGFNRTSGRGDATETYTFRNNGTATYEYYEKYEESVRESRYTVQYTYTVKGNKLTMVPVSSKDWERLADGTERTSTEIYEEPITVEFRIEGNELIITFYDEEEDEEWEYTTYRIK